MKDSLAFYMVLDKVDVVDQESDSQSDTAWRQNVSFPVTLIVSCRAGKSLLNM
jgi:hypothetical protein